MIIIFNDFAFQRKSIFSKTCRTFIYIFLLTSLTTSSQTTFQFISSGASDSAGSGFKTTTTSPSEANLVISNNINQGFAANVLFPDKTITTPTDAVTFTIKADGANTESFDFVDMEIFTYSATPKTVDFETVTQIVFKNASGNVISTWNSLAITTLNSGTSYSIKDIFGQTSGLNNVAEISLTVDYKLSDDITDFEVRLLVLNNLMTLDVEKRSLTKQIKLSPNPTTGTVNISVLPKTIIVYNISGQKLMTTKEKSFNISSLKPGIYFLNIKINNGNIIKRLVKI